MLKPLTLLLAVLALGLSGYYWRFARTSYSSYTAEQLAMFARELQALEASDAGVTMDDRVTADMAAQETARRQRVPLFAVAALLLLVLWAVVPRWPPARSDGEAERLKEFVGPIQDLRSGTAPAMDRHRAAEILGVRTDASPAVIGAAFDALLKERDPQRREGVAPDLQRLMDEQLRELHEARDVLLGKKIG